MNVDVIEARSEIEIYAAHMMVSAYVHTIDEADSGILDTLVENLETGRVTAVMTMINGFPAAIGLLMPASDGARELRCGFVHPDFRGHGAWSAVLDRRVAQCRSEHVSARAVVPATDTRIIHALRRRGFVLDGAETPSGHTIYSLPDT